MLTGRGGSLAGVGVDLKIIHAIMMNNDSSLSHITGVGVELLANPLVDGVKGVCRKGILGGRGLLEGLEEEISICIAPIDQDIRNKSNEKNIFLLLPDIMNVALSKRDKI